MTINNSFFSKRRSIKAADMASYALDPSDLELILAAGIRVPDHGALNPWRIVLIQGNKLKEIDQ